MKICDARRDRMRPPLLFPRRLVYSRSSQLPLLAHVPPATATTAVDAGDDGDG